MGARVVSGLPYYKRFPRDFLDGTIGMDLETKGAYAILLDLIYMRGNRLQEDDTYIAGHLGCSVRKWRAIKLTLQTWRNANGTVGKIRIADGFITNFRADYLGEETRKYRENQAEIASKPRKNKGIQQPKVSQSESDTDRESTNVDSPRAKASRRKPEVAIPDGFPDMPALQAAKLQVMDAGAAVKITTEAERFRNHALTHDRRARDWAAAWRNWIVSAIASAPPLSAIPKTDTVDRWPARVREWREDQNWNRVDWGPRPGEPGCLCPPHLLEAKA